MYTIDTITFAFRHGVEPIPRIVSENMVNRKQNPACSNKDNLPEGCLLSWVLCMAHHDRAQGHSSLQHGVHNATEVMLEKRSRQKEKKFLAGK